MPRDIFPKLKQRGLDVDGMVEAAYELGRMEGRDEAAEALAQLTAEVKGLSGRDKHHYRRGYEAGRRWRLAVVKRLQGRVGRLVKAMRSVYLEYDTHRIYLDDETAALAIRALRKDGQNQAADTVAGEVIATRRLYGNGK